VPIRDKKLSEVLPILKCTYRSIDVRGMFGLKGNQWIIVFVRIRLTRDEMVQVAAEQKQKLDDLGPVDHGNFKIRMGARPIEDIQSVLEELESGIMSVDGLEGRLLRTDIQSMPEKHLGHDLNVCNEEEKRGFPYATVYSSYVSDVLNALRHEIGLKDNEVPIELLKSYFESTNLGYSINSAIILPIYAKMNRRIEQPLNSVLSEAEVHQCLLEHVRFKLFKTDSGTLNKSRVFEPPGSQTSGITKIEIPNMVGPVGATEEVKVVMEIPSLSYEDEIGNIGGELFMRKEAASVPDTLYPAFKLTGASEKFKSFLRSTGTKHEQEVSTSWLLSILGMRPIFLAYNDECEKVKEGKMERGAADVLAFDDARSTLLVIDNTATAPAAQKIDKLRNTAKFIGEKVGQELTPVMITGVDCTSLKAALKGDKVRVVDSNDLNSILEYLDNNAIMEARNAFLAAIGP
jgi:hypothetical protein